MTLPGRPPRISLNPLTKRERLPSYTANSGSAAPIFVARDLLESILDFASGHKRLVPTVSMTGAWRSAKSRRTRAVWRYPGFHQEKVQGSVLSLSLNSATVTRAWWTAQELPTEAANADECRIVCLGWASGSLRPCPAMAGADYPSRCRAASGQRPRAWGAGVHLSPLGGMESIE